MYKIKQFSLKAFYFLYKTALFGVNYFHLALHYSHLDRIPTVLYICVFTGLMSIHNSNDLNNAHVNFL